MKFILILLLVAVTNCLPENEDEGLKHDWSFSNNPTGLPQNKNKRYRPQVFKYGNPQQDTGYKNSDEEKRYKDNFQPRSSYSYESALTKLRKLAKPKKSIKLTMHNFSYCLSDELTVPEQGSSSSSYTEFSNLLKTILLENSGKIEMIQLFYVEFTVERPQLFKTGAKNTVTLVTDNGRKVLNEGIGDMTITDESVTLCVEGHVNLNIELLLGKKESNLKNAGTTLCLFEPQLKISSCNVIYRVKIFVRPPELSEEKTKIIKNAFSAFSSAYEEDMDLFIETYKNDPPFKISTTDVITTLDENLMFDMFKSSIQETQSNTVEINLSKAVVDLYKNNVNLKSSFSKFEGELIGMMDEEFNYRSTGGSLTREFFEKAFKVLQEDAQKINMGENPNLIKTHFMEYLKTLFQEYRERKGDQGIMNSYDIYDDLRFGIIETLNKEKRIASIPHANHGYIFG